MKRILYIFLGVLTLTACQPELSEGECVLELDRIMKDLARSTTRKKKPEYFKEHDFHIHIPEGAVPKDGPSAGITMATAIFSAITKIPVKCKVAMTGEITLRGRVLPIGGLKEKLLAAKSAGVKTVFVPEKNMRDVEEISTEITEGLEIIPVSHMKDVLGKALVCED